MTGHDVRRILSDHPDMMSGRTGSPDIMSGWSDLRKQPSVAVLDMMTGLVSPMIVGRADLRKHATCPGSARTPDIMSDPTTTATASSGRRSP